MPDNVINAMKGLTQYLMVENQRLAVEREDKKINDAASQIAEAYKNLGPDASIEDIRKLQFASVSSASDMGVIQEVMPLINQMQASTLQTFAYNQAEKIRSTTEKFLEDRYGTQLPDGTDPVAMSNLIYGRGEKDEIVEADGKTYAVKFDDLGKETSRRVVSAIGTDEKLDQYRKQKEIDYEFDSKLLRDKANYTNATGGLTGNGVTGPNFAGFDPLLNYQGANGEILYKSKKGRGVYALQPDGSLLFYNGQPQPTKGNAKDVVETMQFQQQLNGAISKGATDQTVIMLSTEAGRTAYTNLTGSALPPDMSTVKEKDYENYATILENAVNSKSWDDIKSKIGKELHGKDGAKDVWNTLSGMRTLPKQREKVNDFLYGTQEPPKKFGKLTQDQYNSANERIMDVFSPQSTLSPEDQAAIKGWILRKVDPEFFSKGNVLTHSAGTYDDFKRLSKEDQLQILEIINESTK